LQIINTRFLGNYRCKNEADRQQQTKPQRTTW
jgi:hypothetical protein